jgi:hypothetical protein
MPLGPRVKKGFDNKTIVLYKRLIIPEDTAYE